MVLLLVPQKTSRLQGQQKPFSFLPLDANIACMSKAKICSWDATEELCELKPLMHTAIAHTHTHTHTSIHTSTHTSTHAHTGWRPRRCGHSIRPCGAGARAPCGGHPAQVCVCMCVVCVRRCACVCAGACVPLRFCVYVCVHVCQCECLRLCGCACVYMCEPLQYELMRSHDN